MDVHLGAHADLAGNVDAGLDRKPHAGNQQPLFARLEVVEMRAGAVERPGVDRVSGAVREVFSEAARIDDTARDVVDVRTAWRMVRGRFPLNKLDGDRKSTRLNSSHANI